MNQSEGSTNSAPALRPAAKRHRSVKDMVLVVRWDMDSIFSIIWDAPKSCVGSTGTYTVSTEKKIKLLRIETKEIEPATILGYAVSSAQVALDMAASTLKRLENKYKKVPVEDDEIYCFNREEEIEMDEIEYLNLWVDQEEIINQQMRLKKKPKLTLQPCSTSGKWLSNK